MKHLEIPFLPMIDGNTPIEDVSAYLDKLDQTPIDTVPWPAFPYKPAVRMAIAHCGGWLLLKYYVREKEIRALYRNTHDPVYRDSCVEFFLAFNQEENYYNLEFNCLGTCLAGFGPGKDNRLPVPETSIDKIKRWAQVEKPADPAAGEDTGWQLTLMIPAEVFWQHQLATFQGLQGRGNFYKCGDELPVPHFLSWNNIEAPEPEFHLPAWFGTLHFQ